MFDHIIVGAGINGSSAAYQLARRGRSVLLLEKFPLPHSRGSSHGQSRGIRKAYPDPYFTNLMDLAYKEWRQIEQMTGVKLIKETGLLCFSDELNNPFMKSTIDAFKQSHSSSDYQLFHGQHFKQSFPSLRLGEEGFGCYDPSGGILMADKSLRAVLDLAVKFGAKIIDGFDLQSIEQSEDIITVHGSDKTSYSSKSLVLCPGPWASQLLSLLGVKLPLRPIKIPVYYWRVHDFISHTFIYEGKTGGNVWGLPQYEYPGLVKICLHEGPDCDPDSRDAADTEYLKLFLQTFIRDHFPGVESEVSVEESCIYTMTPDENPVIDLVPDTNIVIAVGFSGTGFKLGPVTGNMLADLATGVKKKQDVEILSLRRFRQ